MPTELPIAVEDRRKRPYFTIDNALLDTHGKRLGPHGIAVYTALARFANTDQECWPSRRAIHERTGVSLPQINRELNKLVDFGLILITPQFNEKGDQTSNLYTLLDIPADPLITQIPPPLSRREPPLIREITKQSPKKKVTQPNTNKKKGGGKLYDLSHYSDL